MPKEAGVFEPLNLRLWVTCSTNCSVAAMSSVLNISLLFFPGAWSVGSIWTLEPLIMCHFFCHLCYFGCQFGYINYPLFFFSAWEATGFEPLKIWFWVTCSTTCAIAATSSVLTTSLLLFPDASWGGWIWTLEIKIMKTKCAIAATSNVLTIFLLYFPSAWSVGWIWALELKIMCQLFD